MPHSPLLIIIILALLERRRLKAAVPGVPSTSRKSFAVDVSATNLIL